MPNRWLRDWQRDGQFGYDHPMKQKAYIETTIVSYLTARRSGNAIVAGRQAVTEEWWEHRRPAFDLVVSDLVVREAEAGDPGAASHRLARLEGIPLLDVSGEAVSLAETLVQIGPIPSEYAEDALHIALCAVHGVDFLLTWNCKHLANAAQRHDIEACVAAQGYQCPVICTPEELLEE